MSTDSPKIYQSADELNKEQEKINSDIRYWNWFDAWWDQDFSWEGLEKRKIERSDQTLQDYWYAENDKLINFAGRTWTRFHLPPHDREGKVKSEKFGFKDETWNKYNWPDWHAEINCKLENAAACSDPGNYECAQFDGVCFPDFFDLSSYPKIDNEKEALTIHIKANWAWFGNHANFGNAIFGSDTNFQCSLFGNNTTFRDATFKRQADFSHTIIGDEADFIKAKFLATGLFFSARFGINADFTKSLFKEYAAFHNAEFGGAAKFKNVAFLRKCGFTNTNAKLNTNAFASISGIDFSKTGFYGEADFSDREFPKKTYFTGASFHELAKFQGCTFHQDTSFADTEFSLPPKKNTHAEQYQNAFRTLRLHMENLRDHGQELKFARLEMQAMERRVGSIDVPFWVRTQSRIYGIVAGYGQSVWRPFVGLSLLLFIAACSYALIACDWTNLAAALAVAFQYSLPPVSTFAAQFFAGEVDQAFINALLDHPFLTRLVMVSHGVLSLALVFFLLLALKRRFQIR